MINVFKNVQIAMIKTIHLFHFKIIKHVLPHVVQLKKMDNNLKILGIKIIEKKLQLQCGFSINNCQYQKNGSIILIYKII